MKIKKIEESVAIPKGVQISVDNRIITVKGPKGELKKEVRYPQILFRQENDSFILSTKKVTKNEKKEVNTYAAHVKNMLKGADKGHVYELKICSGHFPMNVTVAGGELIIKNFIGEKFPRRLKIKLGASVKVEGDKVIVEHADKEVAGQTAASIEQLTRRPGFDNRIFQDGIYITKKDGKEMN